MISQKEFAKSKRSKIHLRHCTIFMDGGLGGITVVDESLTDEEIDIEALECMFATGTVICIGPLTAISGV